MSSAPTSTRAELSRPSAVTFLVLLLLLGAVDSRSAQALYRSPYWPAGWATGGVVRRAVARSPDREVRVERRHGERASGTEALRLMTHSVRPVRTIADAMLPGPRAPDDDRVR